MYWISQGKKTGKYISKQILGEESKELSQKHKNP